MIDEMSSASRHLFDDLSKAISEALSSEDAATSEADLQKLGVDVCRTGDAARAAMKVLMGECRD
jgi:hypothetical protein